MNPAWLAMLLALLTAAPAIAKFICSPGRFVLQIDRSAGMAIPDGAALELGEGAVALSGVCPSVPGRRFHSPLNAWLYRVRAAWPRCGERRGITLRAHFDGSARYCTRLIGTLRDRRGRRAPFVAERVPACGNRLREPGEQCDGPESAGFGTCCTADCTVKPGCAVQCDQADFPCDESEICTYTCGFSGLCQPRERVDCGSGPVCGCDGATTYPDRCAAFADGTGVAHPGPCRTAAP
jgi:hypothetical protein